MTSRWTWLLLQISRQVWVRASLFCVLAIATALLGVLFAPYIPGDLPTKIGADAVDHILGILAASMLSVTTFSLAIMVSAYSTAASNVTPRATQLIMQDTTAQTVLSTFIGSFLYSLVGIIVLSTGAYGGQGRVILFVVTIAVITLIIVTLLRWIDHLFHLGHVTETTAAVEAATCHAISDYKRHVNRGCNAMPLALGIEAGNQAVFSPRIGYVQHIDLPALAKAAKAVGVKVYITALPGHFVDLSRPLFWVDSDIEDIKGFTDSFTIADTRSFDQDPRFGFCVLAEIASKALSPGLNDPGTAIDVIGRAVRIFAHLAERGPDEEGDILYPDLYLPSLADADLFDDIFTPIARDGASLVEIGIRLQKAFYTLRLIDGGRYAQNARRHSQLALTRFNHALAIDEDKAVIKALADRVV